MQFVVRPRRATRPPADRAGFTLIELLVALSVIGVATTIFTQVYMASMNLGKLSRNRELATSIATEKLSLLEMKPAAWTWETATANPDGIFRIRQNEDDPRAGVLAEPPVVLPFDKVAKEHEQNVYNQFRWKAFGRLRKVEERALFYEVFVDVTWQQKGKDEHVVLTGAIPASQAPANAAEGK